MSAGNLALRHLRRNVRRRGVAAAADERCPQHDSPCTLPELRRSLRDHKFAFLSAQALSQLLPDELDLHANWDQFHGFWDRTEPQRSLGDGSEVYPYKGTLVSYYYLETSTSAGDEVGAHDTDSVDGDSPVVHVSRSATGLKEAGIAGEEGLWVVENVDPTTNTTAELSADTLGRRHRAWPHDSDDNPLVYALQKLLGKLLSQPIEMGLKEAEPKEQAKSECNWEAMQTAFRVTKSPNRHGEPGPEGVHQDDCALTVVVLVGRENVAPGSGGNRVWSLEQPCGKAVPEEPEELNKVDAVENSRKSQAKQRDEQLLWEGMLERPLDAVFLLDREVKHEALPIEVLDIAVNGGVARRDVLTFEVRRAPSRDEF